MVIQGCSQACPSNHLGTFCPCQTVTSCSQEPQVFSTHSPLFPAGVTFSLPIPVKFWGASGTYLGLPPLKREPSLRGPFGILGTETKWVITYSLCACLVSPLVGGP